MANGCFMEFLYEEGTKLIGMTDADSWWMALLRVEPPEWTPNFTVDTLTNLWADGATELDVPGYVRKKLSAVPSSTQPGFARDDGNLRVQWDFDDVTWASLDAGQTVQGLLVYYGTGDEGDDATNIPAFWVDDVSSSNLPYLTTGGSFTVKLDQYGFAWKKYCG